MCGICGVAVPRGARAPEADEVTRMRDVLRHRGPDDAGLYLAEGVALGHRRLSIVDLASGHQPMDNEDGTVVITFNGEIYNHQALRPGLEAAGHTFRTRCDTEAILHLYEESGAACVESLRGMFAFAIWDTGRRSLLLARDRLGIKPLYYAHLSDGRLFFASEIKALLAAGAVKPELALDQLPDYLANHATSGDATLFAGIKRLLPGHTLEWRDGRIRIARYWDLPLGVAEEVEHDDDRVVADWLEVFEDAVRVRLMADVPLGMFLSGGIDSSAIAAVMSRMVDEPIKTFSVAFAEREANELTYARMVARTFATDHHEVVVTPAQFFAALPDLVWHEDEPLAHPSSVPLHFVSALARERVKVVLTGEGSDEMLAGYGRYRKTVYNLRLGGLYERATTRGMRRAVVALLDRIPRRTRLRQRLDRTFLRLPPDLEHLYFDNFAVFGRAAQERLLAPSLLSRLGGADHRGLDPYATLRAAVERGRGHSLLDGLLYADCKTYLHELLMKQDQMSMSASIESRVPFLDQELVRATARLPARYKLRGLTTKYVLRRAMKGVLPDEILKRRKMGFPVPVGRWFRGPHRQQLEDTILGPRARARGIFNSSTVHALLREHEHGERDHSERLWSLLNLELWHRRFIDGEAPTRPSDLETIAAGGVR